MKMITQEELLLRRGQGGELRKTSVDPEPAPPPPPPPDPIAPIRDVTAQVNTLSRDVSDTRQELRHMLDDIDIRVRAGADAQKEGFSAAIKTAVQEAVSGMKPAKRISSFDFDIKHKDVRVGGLLIPKIDAISVRCNYEDAE